MDAQYYLDDYKKAVRKFAEDTKEWNSLDENKFYVSYGYEWEENTNNANRGLDISWAFKKENITDKEIIKKFYEEIIEILRSDIENGVDYINCIDLDYKQ